MISDCSTAFHIERPSTSTPSSLFICKLASFVILMILVSPTPPVSPVQFRAHWSVSQIFSEFPRFPGFPRDIPLFRIIRRFFVSGSLGFAHTFFNSLERVVGESVSGSEKGVRHP